MAYLIKQRLTIVALLLLYFLIPCKVITQTFSPAQWPNDASYRSYTLNGQTVFDLSAQDQSNGGATPQGYVNISSGSPEQTKPSVYYFFDGTNLFIRFRLEGNGIAYTGGSTAGNVDPWKSAQWTMILDVNGDGWRDFAILLDGSSGSPSSPIDVIKVIYSNLTTSQTIDQSTSGVYALASYFAAQKYSSGPYQGELEQFNGSGNIVSGAPWPQGNNTTVYDFGMTRGIDNSATGGGYFLDFQLPVSSLNASVYGGPVVTANTYMTASFVTSNSLTDPFQKDFAFLGTFTASSGSPGATGDIFTPVGGTVTSPIVTSVSASSCPSVLLKTTVMDAMKVLPDGVTVASSISTATFYYWSDVNGNGVADVGEASWVLIGAGSAGAVGTWTITWNPSTIPRGEYLVKVIAIDGQSNQTDSYTENFTGYSQIYTVFNNTCGINPPSLSLAVSSSLISANGDSSSRLLTYTITVTNPLASAITLSNITDLLPSTFKFIANAAGGTLTPTTSPSVNAIGTIVWAFSPSVSITAGNSATLKFTVLAGTSFGTYSNSVTATGSTSITAVSNAAPVVVSDAFASVSNSSSTTATLTPGQTYSYNINYQNTGSIALTNTLIEDSLVAGMTFVSASSGGTYNSTTRKVSWSLGTVNIGLGGVLTINVSVSSPFSGISPFRNSGKLTSTEIPLGIISNIVTNSIAAPTLFITKSVTPVNALPGNLVSYNLSYGNSGSSAATTVTFIDTLPSTLTFVTGTSSPFVPVVTTTGIPVRQILSWSAGTVPSGSVNNAITFQALVANPFPTAGVNQTVSNTAYLNSSQTAPVSSLTTLLVSANPNVSLVISSDTVSYTTNDTTTLTYTLYNTGNTSAALTSLVDSLPTGFSYVSTGGGTLSPTTSPTVGATGAITWTFSPSVTVNAGATVTLIFKAKVSTTSATYKNTALATGTFVSTNQSTISSSVVVVVSTNTETIQKTVNDISGFTGDTLTYSLFFQNNTAINQTSRTVRDTLAASLTFVSQTAIVSDASTVTFTQSGNALKWALTNNFRNGKSVVITIRAIANTTGTITNKCSAHGAPSILVSNVVSTTIVSPPNFTFTKTVNKSSAPVKSILTYTINYSNAIGVSPGTNVVITDSIPANLTFIVGSATSGGTFSSLPAPKGRVTWNIGTVAANSSGSVSFSVSIDSPVVVNTILKNTAYIRNSENNNKNAIAQTTVLGLPNFSISKSADKTFAAPGDTITYAINYKNTGTASSTVTIATDSIPANTAFVSATGGGTFASGKVTWSIGTVAVNISGALTVKIKINSPLLQNSVSQISNNASIRSNEVTTINSNSIITTLLYPDFSINKTVDSAFVHPSGILTYTILVLNNSLVSAPGTLLYDSIPLNATYITSTTTLNSLPVADVSGTTALINGLSLGTLTSNQSATVTFKIHINSPLANGIRVSNRSRITSSILTNTIFSNSVLTPVQSFPNLTLTKTSSVSGSAIPGAIITYTLTYGNAGTVQADNYNLSDAIPVNTSYIVGSISGDSAFFDAAGNRIFVSRSFVPSGAANRVVTFQVKVNSPLPDGNTTIANSATASAGNAASVSASANVIVAANSILSISTSAPATSPLVGLPLTATFTYTISYGISGNATTDGVIIKDTLPAGITYLSSKLNGIASGSVSGQIVTWSVGSVNLPTTGQASVTVKTTAASTYANRSKILSNQNLPGVLSNTVSTIVTAPFTGTIIQTATILPGNSISFTVTDNDLKGQSLIFVNSINTRTNELESIGLVETGTNSGVFTGTVSSTFGTTAGTTSDGYFNVQSGDTIRTTYNDVANGSGNAATVTSITRVLGGSTATLVASPALLAAGNSITFTITDADLNHNALSIETYAYQSISSTGETELLTFTETGVNSGIFGATIATIYGTTLGTNNNGIFTVKPADTVSITYLDTLKANGASGSIIAKTVVGAVNFTSSSKSVVDMNGGQVIPNDTLSYTIKIKNTGTVTATSTIVADTLPLYVTVITGSISNGGTVAGRVISFPTFSLIVNDSVVRTYRVKVDTSMPNQYVGTNKAFIAANGASQILLSSFTAFNRPVMTVQKSVDKNSAMPGDTLTYTLTYSNAGTSMATFVTITDPSPGNTTYLAGTIRLNNIIKTDVADSDEATVTGNSLLISVGQVQAGQSGIIKFKVIVN